MKKLGRNAIRCRGFFLEFRRVSSVSISSISSIRISENEKLDLAIYVLILSILGCLEYLRIILSIGSTILLESVRCSFGILIANDFTAFPKKEFKVFATPVSSAMMFSHSIRVILLFPEPVSEKMVSLWPNLFYYL